MNLRLICFSIILLLAVSPAPGAPAKPPVSPAQKLTPFIENVDFLLASNPPRPKVNFVNGASSKLAIFKTLFIEEAATADPELRAKLAAAIRTCNLISAAIDERQRTLGQMQAANAVKGSDLIGQRRKDVLNQGVRGGTFAKAVGEVEEGKRERREHKEQAARATADDQAISAGVANHWKERAIQLRQQILTSYTQIALATAPAVTPAPVPPAPVAPPPAPAAPLAPAAR
jgi:hypothetical protein